MINVSTIINQTTNEVSIWKNRVISAGGGFEWDSIAIANNFIRRLKTKSYYKKIIYLLPMLGKGVNAAKIPLIDVLNVGAATNSGFVDADFTQSGGLNNQAEASKYFDSLIKPSQLGSSNNGGLGWWELNIGFGSGVEPMGSYSSDANNRYVLDVRSGTPVYGSFRWGNAGNGATDSVTRTEGAVVHIYGQRSSNILRNIYDNGIFEGTNTTSDSSTGSSDNNIYIMGVNTSPIGYWKGTCGLIYLTDGTLTSDEISDFDSFLRADLLGPAGKIFYNPVPDYFPSIWLEADYLSLVSTGPDVQASDGDLVLEWRDRSVNHNDAAQTTSANRPTYITNGSNGKPTIRFSAGSRYLIISSQSYSQVTIFLVLNPITISSQQIFIQWGTGATVPQDCFHYWNDGTSMGCFFQDSSSVEVEPTEAGASTTGTQIGVARFNSAPVFAKNGIFGTAKTSNGTLHTSSSKIGIGVKLDSTGTPTNPSYFTGDISAIIVYPSALTDSQVLIVSNFLKSKYIQKSSLFNSLVEWWELNEASGTRLGSFANISLTDNGGVGSDTGVSGLGVAAKLNGTKSLSHISDTTIQVGDFDFTFAGWVYFDSNPIGAFPVIFNKYSGSSDRQIYLYCEAAIPQLRFVGSPAGTSVGEVGVYASTFGTISAGQWYFVMVQHDSINDTIGISVNNSAIDTAAMAGGIFGGGIAPLLFGIDSIGGSGTLYGRLAKWGYWKRLLSSTERTQLYNSGKAIAYPF